MGRVVYLIAVALTVGLSACGSESVNTTTPAADPPNVNNTAPVAPTVTGTTPTTDVTPTWNWTGDSADGSGNYRYKLDDTNLASGATTTTATSYTPVTVLTATAHTLYVQESDSAGNWSTSGSYTITIDIIAPDTSASPAGGTYYSAQTVTLSINETGTTYYTTDSSVPTTDSTVYSGSINFTDDATLKFFSVDTAGNTEPVKTEVYVIGTSVSGSIASDTTLALSNSPYSITGSVQVEDAAVLTIEPGAEINGGTITVYGTLNAIGTASQKVSFTDTAIWPAYNADVCNINISYAHITGGGVWGESSSDCSLVLNNSVLTNADGIRFFLTNGAKTIEKNILLNPVV